MYGSYQRWIRESAMIRLQEDRAARRIVLHVQHSEKVGIECPDTHLTGARPGWTCPHCGWTATKED